MRINEALKQGFKLLKDKNIEDYNIISKELLIYVLKKDKMFILTHQDDEIDTKNYEKYKLMLDEIIKGKPLQYITNHQEFMKINFYVDENVLIPQPDTEVLVEEVLKICSEYYEDEVTILDLCTGSGAIAISLDKNIKIQNRTIYASDISEKALRIAIKNNINNKANVILKKSDIFENFQNIKFDIIVSNPPYIRTDVIDTLPKQVRNEPKIALDGGIDGLYFYRKIICQAVKYLNKDSFLCLEIGFDQSNDVIDILNKTNQYKEIQLLKDLSGNDRCIIAKRSDI